MSFSIILVTVSSPFAETPTYSGKLFSTFSTIVVSALALSFLGIKRKSPLRRKQAEKITSIKDFKVFINTSLTRNILAHSKNISK